MSLRSFRSVPTPLHLPIPLFWIRCLHPPSFSTTTSSAPESSCQTMLHICWSSQLTPFGLYWTERFFLYAYWWCFVDGSVSLFMCHYQPLEALSGYMGQSNWLEITETGHWWGFSYRGDWPLLQALWDNCPVQWDVKGVLRGPCWYETVGIRWEHELSMSCIYILCESVEDR